MLFRVFHIPARGCEVNWRVCSLPRPVSNILGSWAKTTAPENREESTTSGVFLSEQHAKPNRHCVNGAW